MDKYTAVIIVLLSVPVITGIMIIFLPALMSEADQYNRDRRDWLKEYKLRKAELVQATHLFANTDEINRKTANLEGLKVQQPEIPGWMFWIKPYDTEK